MTLEVSKIIRVYCPICDYLRYYNTEDKIPKVCPACGGNEEAFAKMWEARKEEIYTKLGDKYEHILGRA
jgi:hypothetical protein